MFEIYEHTWYSQSFISVLLWREYAAQAKRGGVLVT
ncbi:MAG: hypothetical protein JWP44_1093 [Mucilaginibacter sp.]|nr:hypothetical protein [Mucilaginibacter sp.]